MQNLHFYEIDNQYINFLSRFEEHIFHNSKKSQENERKYIGILFEINEIKYFVPLSSFKEKHKRLSESLDFVKVGNFAVLNLNNMIPVSESEYKLVDINKIINKAYKDLLENERRIIASKSELIRENAKAVYEHKIKNGNKSKLGKRCNDFLNLEKLCLEYSEKESKNKK